MRLFTFLLTILAAAPAFAWWDAGHKIAASIAYRQLSPEQRRHVATVLRAHPRWEQDFQGAMPESVRDGDVAEQDEWIFQQAAVWPDLARDFQGDDRTTYHHSTWHYINLPQFLTPADQTALRDKLTVNINRHPPETPVENMNIIQTIGVARQMIANRTVPAESRAVMLCWLFHTVGDIHQPLHSTALFSRHLFPEGCRGGNQVKTMQRGNLHSLWDSLPGERIPWREARNKALTWIEQSDAHGRHAAQTLTSEKWLTESHDLVKTAVYDDEVLAELRAAETAGQTTSPMITLSERYLQTAGGIADRRVIEAGYRLGAVLHEAAR